MRRFGGPGIHGIGGIPLASLAGYEQQTEITLPQYLFNSSTSLETFENAADWSTSGASVTVADNAAQFLSGTQSIKVTLTGINGSIWKTVNWDLSSLSSRIRIHIYRHDDNLLQVRLALANDAAITQFKYQMLQPTYQGWNTFHLAQADFLDVGGASFANPIIRVAIQVTNTAAPCSISLDLLSGGVDAVPAILFTFDDEFDEQYTDAFPYFSSKAARGGTIYVRTDNIGAAGYCTAAQLVEMDAAGWAMGNHTTDHTNLSTLAEADQEAHLADAKTILDGLGLARASAHVSYPLSGYNADTMTAMVATGMLSGRTTSGLSVQGGLGLPMSGTPYQIRSDTIDGAALATVQALIDTIKSRQIVGLTLMHNPTGADLTLLQNSLDYAISQHVMPLTIADIYALMSGPLTVARPVGW